MAEPNDTPTRDIYAEAIDAAMVRHVGTPMDIWEAANKLSAAIADDSGWIPSADVFDAIVAALAAEREACAALAEVFAQTSNSRDVDVAIQEAAICETADKIAAAIRNRR